MTTESVDDLSLRVALLVEAIRAVTKDAWNLSDEERHAVRTAALEFIRDSGTIGLVGTVKDRYSGYSNHPLSGSSLESIGHQVATHRHGDRSDLETVIWQLELDDEERNAVRAAFDQISQQKVERTKLKASLATVEKELSALVSELERDKEYLATYRHELTEAAIASRESSIAMRQLIVTEKFVALADAGDALSRHVKLYPSLERE